MGGGGNLKVLHRYVGIFSLEQSDKERGGSRSLSLCGIVITDKDIHFAVLCSVQGL